MITIHVNGEKKGVPESLTLAALLEWLKLPGDRVAVERNLEIVPRARWHETAIQDGDRLEVVHFVGGGCEFGFEILDFRLKTRHREIIAALGVKSKIQNLRFKTPK